MMAPFFFSRCRILFPMDARVKPAHDDRAI
jgi:hypothetical protein